MRKSLLLLTVLLAGCVPPRAIRPRASRLPRRARGVELQPTQPAQAAEPARAALLLAALATLPAHAQATFDDWLAAFRQDAEAQGISPATLDAAFDRHHAGRARDRARPRASPNSCKPSPITWGDASPRTRLRAARPCWQEHAALLDAVEQQYGIPKAVLVAFWGLETHYGTMLGSLNIPASLATLACDGRRSAFFRSQLLDALRIIDAGHVSAIDMNGSWAGAMGHMQFMPSTFRAYAVDGDGDGRIDLWQSLPDAMHSAANYLKRAGWRMGEPVAWRCSCRKASTGGHARVAHRLPVARMDGARRADGGRERAAGRGRAVPPSCCRRAGRGRLSWCSTISTW